MIERQRITRHDPKPGCTASIARDSGPMGIPFRFEATQTSGASQVDAVWHCAQSNPGAENGVDSEGRNCGDCHACCIHLPIPAGEVCAGVKLAGVECPHLAEHGCRIYQERPATCQQFKCVWFREPTWPGAWRPDQSGLLCLREEIDEGVSAALVYEIERDAIARPTTELILAKLRESTALVALVNLQRQRQLLPGRQWVEGGELAVRPPHFLKPIRRIGVESTEKRRDAS